MTNNRAASLIAESRRTARIQTVFSRAADTHTATLLDLQASLTTDSRCIWAVRVSQAVSLVSKT